MSLTQGIMESIRAAQSRPRPLVERATGRKWQLQLQAVLRVPVQDRTHYAAGITYFYEAALPPQPEHYWLYRLRIWISGVGPYVTQAFVRESRQARWGGACQLSRGGFEPEHKAVLANLRAWYPRVGLIELDEETRGLPVLLPNGRESHVHRCLFGM